MKKILLLSFIFSAISCSSDIVPDSLKVCALMEDQIEYLEEGLESNDRLLIRSNLNNYKTINDQIVSIKSKYDENKFNKQLNSICTDGEGDILELTRSLEEELFSLEVQEVCDLQINNHAFFIYYYDEQNDGNIERMQSFPESFNEAISRYNRYTAKINEIRSNYNKDVFDNALINCSYYNKYDSNYYDYKELFENLPSLFLGLMVD